MNNALVNRDQVFVLYVEPQSTMRSVIHDILRDLGFGRSQGVSTTKDALAILEVEVVHWLITPLCAQEAVNAMQLLKLITMEPRLRGTLTSLMFEPGKDDYCLALAFELGLFSCHAKTYVKEELASEFEQLLALLAINEHNATLTAADYLRPILTEMKMHKSRLALEQNLLALYSGSAQVLVNLAEAEILAGAPARALGLLRQAEVIDPSMGPLCERMREKHLKDAVGLAPLTKNVLGVKLVVVIDPDTDVLYATSEMLKELGVEAVETFEDGKKAWDWLNALPPGNSREPGLLLMEWRIIGLSGPALVQRLRLGRFITVPIIVGSSLIKREEKPLLREMGVDELLVKPFDKHHFYEVVIWALQQNKVPTEERSLATKIKRLLVRKQFGEAERLVAQFVEDSRIREAAKKEMIAELAFAHGRYRGACEAGVEAIRLGGKSLGLLNLVGKSLLKLQFYGKALQCFERAQEICAINVERLLTIAECNLHLDRPRESAKALAEAIAMDEGNPLIAEAKLKFDLETGNLSAAADATISGDAVLRVGAYINNRAIALARTGRFADGIALYHRAIQALSERWHDLGATVSYNLGLCLARYGEYEEAIKVLTAVCAQPTVSVFKKANALLIKLRRATKKGVSLNLDIGPLDPPKQMELLSNEQHLLDLMNKAIPKQGDLACYLIFYCIDPHSTKAQALLNDMPRFNARPPLLPSRDDALQKVRAR